MHFVFGALVVIAVCYNVSQANPCKVKKIYCLSPTPEHCQDTKLTICHGGSALDCLQSRKHLEKYPLRHHQRYHHHGKRHYCNTLRKDFSGECFETAPVCVAAPSVCPCPACAKGAAPCPPQCQYCHQCQ